MLNEFKKQTDVKCMLITSLILIVFLLSGWRAFSVHAAEGTSVISQQYAYERIIA